MKIYNVVLSTEAQEDLHNCLNYLKYVKQNQIAAKNVLNDYNKTKKNLAYVADALPVSDSLILKKYGLKRMNFTRHNYFFLFYIQGENVIITNIFHASEDYENKLI